MRSFFRALYGVVHIEGCKAYGLPPAEGEEALGEIDGFFGGGEYLVHVSLEGIGFTHGRAKQGSESRDHGEDVVEVMGDAPCQGAYGFHFLGLEELGLELCFFCLRVLEVRDVELGGHPECGPRYGRHRIDHVVSASAAVNDPEFVLPGRMIGIGLPAGVVCPHEFEVFFMDEVRPFFFAFYLFPGIPGELDTFFVAEDDGCVLIDNDHGRAGVVEDGAVHGVGAEKFFFDLLPPCRVFRTAFIVEEPAVRVPHSPGIEGGPYLPPVFSVELGLESLHASVLIKLVYEPLSVVRVHIGLSCNVAHALEEFLGGVVAEHPGEGRIEA